MKKIKIKKSNKKFFSNNIIFFDTEFSNIDIEKGELISLALVKMTGEELYLEFDYKKKELHPWVKENVIPYLSGHTTKKKDALNQIWDFVGREGEKPYLMAYVNQFDSIYWYRLFADPKNHPAFWIPIDFASILFSLGYDPEVMRDKEFFKELKIDTKKYNKHNALDDAKLLAETFKKMKALSL
ncbi:MAG: hypothetical protein WC070_01295 [Candidatus Magasanikbacteria bacterium]